MSKKSAGILLYRFKNELIEFLIVHPGGPFWAKKDLGAWSIPKGEFNDNEDPLDAAIREFNEEMGSSVSGEFIPMTPIKQNSGKIVHAFALEKDFDIKHFKSNTFQLEWPPKSGKIQEFPEIDKAEWLDYFTTKQKLNEQQIKIIEELVERLGLTIDNLQSIQPTQSHDKPNQLDLFS